MTESKPIFRPNDPHATRIPHESGLLPCLYIPIAARSLIAVETYVGPVVVQLAPDSPDMAVLVQAHMPDPPDDRLAIWAILEAGILRRRTQGVGLC